MSERIFNKITNGLKESLNGKLDTYIQARRKQIKRIKKGFWQHEKELFL